MKEDDIGQLRDYGSSFCEQYTHGSCYISLFRFKSFDQFDASNFMLDIYSVVALDVAFLIAVPLSGKTLVSDPRHLN